jgi:Tol biopolymer transport system component
MGEVYRGRDTRLDRTVAIKILPQALAAAPEFRERFDREARAIAALSHPHICTLYDVGVDDGTSYLVMEHLEGQTLADRLAKGPLPIDEVFRYAAQIADALEKAHRAGIVHRDLKPGNVMITKSGAKLLDFGLAKSAPSAIGASVASILPTTPLGLTAQGTILGTFQYMAPEQIEGQEADARTDVFAFGALLYEMTTGRRAFEGKTQASLIAAILGSEPPAMSTLQTLSPASLDRLVTRCLAKDPDRRWQSARDIALELEWIASGASAAVPAPVTRRDGTRERLEGTVAIVALVALVAAAVPLVRGLLRTPETPPLVRFDVDMPPGVILDGNARPVLSPDGRHLAFVGRKDGDLTLWVRSLDSLEARQIPVGRLALQIFWSPDSRYLGFFAEGKLKRVDVTGGAPQTICDAVATPGIACASWSQAGVIVFASGNGERLFRVSDAGGMPTAITHINTSAGETAHVAPYFLPDGRRFVYLARGSTPDTNIVYAASLDSNDVTPVLRGTSEARYAAPGYLLFLRGTTLTAQRFDAERMTVSGDAMPVADNVRVIGVNSVVGAFSTSLSGALAYRGGAGLAGRQLALFDRSAKTLAVLDAPAAYDSPAFSPDGQRVAAALGAGSGGLADVWILDRMSGNRQRLTFEAGGARFPTWSPDGDRIAFVTQTGTIRAIRSNGSGGDDVLATGAAVPDQWSADGKYVTYTRQADWEGFVQPLDRQGSPIALVQKPFNAGVIQIAPNGKWFAYVSSDSGRNEVYVQSFPPPGGKWQVSRSGGSEPEWRRDGKELFFLAPNGMLTSVPVRTDGTFEAGAPVELFQTRFANYGLTRNHYDVTADGQTFVVTTTSGENVTGSMTVVMNWTSALERDRR